MTCHYVARGAAAEVCVPGERQRRNTAAIPPPTSVTTPNTPTIAVFWLSRRATMVTIIPPIARHMSMTNTRMGGASR